MQISAAASLCARVACPAMIFSTISRDQEFLAITRAICVVSRQSTTSTRSSCCRQRPDSTSKGISNTMQVQPAAMAALDCRSDSWLTIG